VELKELNQQHLSAYTRYTGYAGLHIPFDFERVEGNVYYNYEEFRFECSNGVRVDDWTLSPSCFDKFLKLARKTEKRIKQEERLKRREYGD